MKHNVKRKKPLSFEALEDRRVLATFTVSSLVDSDLVISPNCVTGNTVPSLRAAVQAANQCTNQEDTVQFDNVVMAGTITLGTPNAILISDDLIIRGGLMPNRGQARGPSPEVIIDANGMSQVFVIDNSSGTLINVTIEDFELTGGTTGSFGLGQYGGAIYSAENLTLRDMVIQGNSARSGGGVYDTIGAGHLYVFDSLISNNYAYQGGGGVQASGNVYISGSTISGNTSADTVANPTAGGGGLQVGGDVLIEESTISGNSADRNGGGIRVNYVLHSELENRVQILDSDISGNTAQIGGGLLLSIRTEPATTEVANTSFTGNVASYGGGIFNYGGSGAVSDLLLSQVTMSGNRAFFDGAAIQNQRDSHLTVDSSVIESNTAPAGTGGAIHSVAVGLGASLPPELTIENSALVNNIGAAVRSSNSFLDVSTSTISGNSSMGSTPGLRIAVSPAYDGGPYDTTALIQSTTIASNVSDSAAGAIDANSSSDLTVESSIVSGNTGMGMVSDITGGAMPTVNYSLLELGAPGYTGLGNIIGMSAMLGPLTTTMGAGRVTMYHPLLSSSPVIDQGSPSIAYGFDQRRYLRVGDGDGMMGAVTDMGSFEYGSVPPVACDLNGDGNCDITDLNQVSSDVVNQALTLYSDLNSDGSLSSADVLEWLTIGGAHPGNVGITGGNPFLQGDANLDGAVNGSDFLIWNANKFTDSDFWGEGDFNTDGTVNGQDFLIWNSNKFTSSMLVEAALEEEEESARSRESQHVWNWIMEGDPQRPLSR